VLETIYVALLDEGTDCWRPVQAERISDSEFVLHGSVSEDERWEFQPGDHVRCVSRTFSNGQRALVAVEKT
jgi:hypothetical protein